MSAPVPSVPTFLESYPEFSKATMALLQRKLAEAARRTNAAVFTSDEAVDAVCLKAAVLLTLSPEARKLKLVSDDQAFIWGNQLYELQRSATMGMRVF
jgi:hypothetical protein